MTGIIHLDEKPVLDLSKVHFQHQQGSILVLGSWYMDRETRRSQPCLVLLDAKKKVARKRVIPCVIPLSDMWRWTLEMGDPVHVATNIHDWLTCGALPGSAANKRDVWNVMDAVQSRLRDLWAMPPLPFELAVRNSAVPVGTIDVTERNTGKIVDQIEVTSSHVRT